MEKLLEFIVKKIVETPEKVEIQQSDSEGMTNFSLKVDQEDLKLVIGKKGRTIRSIRSLLRLRAFKERKRVNLQLVES